MNIHLVVDYSFLYYKYKFQLEAGRMRRLFCKIEENGEIIDKDVSQIYYSLKEIEGFRRTWEGYGHNVTVSVCFDMPSKRKKINSDAADKYKSNREHKLVDTDFDNIRLAQSMLDTAGYNTYRVTDCEADDIIWNLVNKYKDDFDAHLIYTPDADLAVNIRDNIALARYKTKQGYTTISTKNFTEYLSGEMKCNMPHNAVMLYKCTVGDKSDCIDGIRGFGPAAFDKLVEFLNSKYLDWSIMWHPDNVKYTIKSLEGYFDSDKISQALEAFNIVKPIEIPNNLVPKPTNISTREKRELAYSKYQMNSLIE